MPFKKLQKLSLEKVELINLLTERLASQGLWLLQPLSTNKVEVRAVSLMLEIGGVRVSVFIARNLLTERLGLHAFSVHSATARADLWRMRGGRIWHALEQALQLPMLPITASGEELIPDNFLPLCVGSRHWSLQWWADPQSMLHALRLSPYLAKIHPGNAAISYQLSALPLTCELRLSPISIERKALGDLSIGDFLVLDSLADALLPGQLFAREIARHYHVTYDKKGNMRIQDNIIDIDQDQSSVQFDDTHNTISISVELAVCTLTLGELTKLRPGTVMRLSKPLDDLRVTFRYQGRELAAGRLLEIGDVFGVHLTEVSVNAAT